MHRLKKYIYNSVTHIKRMHTKKKVYPGTQRMHMHTKKRVYPGTRVCIMPINDGFYYKTDLRESIANYTFFVSFKLTESACQDYR